MDFFSSIKEFVNQQWNQKKNSKLLFYLVVNLKKELSMDCVAKLAPLHTLVDF